MNIAELKETKRHWKEINQRNEIISICKKDEEGRNDGICYFYLNGNIDHISEWKNGEEISDSGYCKIYDEPNHVFFEGHFENGKREGKGKEIDLNGKVVFEGLYRNGKRTNMVVVKEMKGYWKEMNEDNEVISICKKNEKSENDGICYFYSNGNIERISEWRNGKEVNVLKRFEGKKMIEFVKGVKRYEGEYRDSIKYNYPREGNGEEYDTDGKSLVYHGCYWNGKRQGQGKLYRNGDVIFDGIWLMGCGLNHILLISMIMMIISTIISFVCFWWWMGMIPLGLNIISSIVFWIYYYCNFYRNKKKNNIGKSFPMKSDNKNYTKLIHFVIWIFVVIMFNIIFVLSIFITGQSIMTNCLGSYFQTSIVTDSGSCNYDFITSFKPKSRLEYIEIGDDCFENVDLFKVDGLNELKSLKIGINSFTHLKSGNWDWKIANNRNRSFSVLNCFELESIEIGEYSFVDYGGGFELINLPKLSTIKIGEIGSDSSNFFVSSFIVKGIIDDDIANE